MLKKLKMDVHEQCCSVVDMEVGFYCNVKNNGKWTCTNYSIHTPHMYLHRVSYPTKLFHHCFRGFRTTWLASIGDLLVVSDRLLMLLPNLLPCSGSWGILHT